jgi:hypothetical protein
LNKREKDIIIITKGDYDMNGIETAERLSKKYAMTLDDFIKIGSSSMLKDKKSKLQGERIEILSRYEARTVKELEEKIENGKIQEHPGWEDLIELKNIESEIAEINRDIYSLQTA